MLRKVQSFIEQEQLVQATDKVIVGFSGGADSLALLYLLHTLGYACVAAHCNFHLRAEESNRDAAFCRQWAKDRQLTYEEVDFDTLHHAALHKLSVEMAARELRYAWFEELRIKHRAQVIAVGHHKDDSVETVLLNLLRGTGIKGLIGIRPKQGKVIRPLLSVSRSEIEAYLHAQGISYVTDSTNLEDSFVRNKIRLQVLPLLEQINPSVSEAIERTAANLQQVEAVYIHSMVKAVAELTEEGANETRFSIPAILEHPSPQALLYELLMPYGFTPSAVGDVFLALGRQSGKEFLSPSHRLLKDRDYLLLDTLCPSTTQPVYIQEHCTQIAEPIALQIQSFEKEPEFRVPTEAAVACLDKDKLHFPLLLRRWEPGDYFIPYGMKGKQKLSKYFKDHKFSRRQKEAAWVLCSNGEVVWIVGHRTDDRFKMDHKTQWVYCVRC